MKFKFAHSNITVRDIEKSKAFYEKAYGLRETDRIDPGDDSCKFIMMAAENEDVVLELYWEKGVEPKPLPDNIVHFAYSTYDFDEAHALHEKMGVLCKELPGAGVYFIKDPDGYWSEVMRMPR